MKNFLNIFLALIVISVSLTSCIEDQKDFKYNGPTVAEFKNSYLERQSRLGTANFSAAYQNVVTVENTSLTKLTVRQPSIPRTGTITATTGSVNVTGVGTAFTTELQVGSIIRNAAMSVVGSVASIIDDNALVLNANGAVAVTGAGYRASVVPTGDLMYEDSILVQLVGRQVPSEISITYMEDFESPLTPEGAVEAIEGIHYDFLRNEAGELIVNGNSSSGYIYLRVYDVLSTTEPDRVTLMITLTDEGDVAPSENYKTFTYNIIK